MVRAHGRPENNNARAVVADLAAQIWPRHGDRFFAAVAATELDDTG
jgi:hypothetical protein